MCLAPAKLLLQLLDLLWKIYLPECDRANI
jgi:hypothetical protein